MNRLNRREVLRLGGLGLGGLLLGPRALGSAQPNPSPLNLSNLPLLPIRRPEPGLVEADLVARPATLDVAGRSARLLTYNGAFPGPVLRVRESERVRLNFTNRLNEATNLHLHGLHVPPAVDDPFRHVAPGETVILEFDLPEGSAGTYWFHPHFHGRTAVQQFAGLTGAIVVEGPLENLPELRAAQEHLVVLRDLTLQGGQPAGHAPMDWMRGKQGNLRLVNGQLKPSLRAERSTLRLRLVNASNARTYRLKLEHHLMHLIATDGGFLGQPVALEEIALHPGQRAEVLVPLRRAGQYRLLDLGGSMDMMSGMMVGTDQGGMMGDSMGGMMGGGDQGGMMGGETQPATLLTVVVLSQPKALALPAQLAALEVLEPDQAAVTRRIVLSETMMPMQPLLNGRRFDPQRTDIAARLGDLEVWELENRSHMAHPFHLHTYPFQVVSRNDIPTPFTAWKDTVNLEPNDVVRLAVPFRDFTGRTVYHCHIAEHNDRGMMGVLEVAEGSI